MTLQPVLLAGKWQNSDSRQSFRGEDPTRCEPLADEYPISTRRDCDTALDAATGAMHELRSTSAEKIAQFLEAYAALIDEHAEALCEMAHRETALPIKPRLKDVELPRTTNQLRQAAAAARDGGWSMPTIDTRLNIRSRFAGIGPVLVFGPNNFPFAFNSVAGGDFAAALAAGNPVIAKANTSHPGTTRLFADLAHRASQSTAMPAATVQLIYRTSHEDGERLVSDPRTGATGYTGSRSAGLKLKAAADAAGKPIYLELSSINPVIILPAALRERSEAIADEFTTSCLMGAGQFCTNPGLVLLLAGDESDRFLRAVIERFEKAPVGTLLSCRVGDALAESVTQLTRAGAQTLTGGARGGGSGYSFANTLLRTGGREFLQNPHALQREAFGNASLAVVTDDVEQAAAVIDQLEGALTGCIYSHNGGEDDRLYDRLVLRLRPRVGRLLNDKMPTGVAVSPAMNHGGPYPATGHPGFTAVGIPASLRRFAVLECYDNVREHRLPVILRNQNSTGATWRFIDGVWAQFNVG
ncbi:MAG: aldehyde dehydrogenase (NADP(+)) [Pirellulales bacterium]